MQYVFLEGIPHLPWIRKARHLIDVRASEIEIDGTHAARRHRDLDARRHGESRPSVPVACGIPGYDRAGHELYADELTVDDDPFRLGADRQLRVRLATSTTPRRARIEP